MIAESLTDTLFESFPEEQLASFGDEESEDLLDDLGYLTIDQNAIRIIDEETYKAALAAFRADCKSFRAAIDSSFKLPYHLPKNQLCKEEIDFLNLVTFLPLTLGC